MPVFSEALGYALYVRMRKHEDRFTKEETDPDAFVKLKAKFITRPLLGIRVSSSKDYPIITLDTEPLPTASPTPNVFNWLFCPKAVCLASALAIILSFGGLRILFRAIFIG